MNQESGPAPAYAPQFYWLPPSGDWDAAIREISNKDDAAAWNAAVRAANCRIGFVETLRLDRAVRKRFPVLPEGLAKGTARLALLGSSTLEHLTPGIRVGGLRRGLWTAVFTGNYGQYTQELLDSGSALHQFQPTTVQFCFDEAHLLGTDMLADAAEAETQVDAAARRVEGLWKTVRDRFDCPVIQQAILPRALPVFGNNEHQVPGSPRRMTHALNERLRQAAHRHGIDILSLDEQVMTDGIAAWHDAGLWHRAKQEISPAASHYYGELVGRLLAARKGMAAKCLVLDLDNTLWGGVIGDDGLEGIKLGQGHALGEAYVAFQQYVRNLLRRGIILAVCSKNDEQNALAPFQKHPEMVLRQADIACFVANWDDKAANIREIARRLNIGLDHMVFADDNPFERNFVRGALPAVSVPELPADPSLYARCIADAGYFEGIFLTADDLARTRQYHENRERETLRETSGSLEDYLRELKMELQWAPFDDVGLERVTQLINKTNQFNLTTRRYSENEVRAAMEDENAITLQLRLADRYGDNGIISILIARANGEGDAAIDTWLMSCRVLGRGVEKAALNLLAAQARERGLRHLIGEYLRTEKNQMVAAHYQNLGFAKTDEEEGRTLWKLELANFQPIDTFLTVTRSAL